MNKPDELLDQLHKAIRTHANRHRTPSGMMYWKHEDQMTEDAMRAAMEYISKSPQPEERRTSAEIKFCPACDKEWMNDVR